MTTLSTSCDDGGESLVESCCCCCCCWKYEGEGGRNAVFSLVGAVSKPTRTKEGEEEGRPSTSPSRGSQHEQPFVLRVRKSDLNLLVVGRHQPKEDVMSSSSVAVGSVIGKGQLVVGNTKNRKEQENKVPSKFKTNRLTAPPPRRDGGDVGPEGGCDRIDNDDGDDEIVRLHRFLDAITCIDDNHDAAVEGGDCHLVNKDVESLLDRTGTTQPIRIPRRGRFRIGPRGNDGGVDGVVVGILSGTYMDKPVAVPISWDLAITLHRSAIESGRIPASRRKDWHAIVDTTSHRSVDPIAEHLAWGLRISDYRFLTPSIIPHQPIGRPSVSVVSLEIKPKAGYRSFSPLVHPDRRVKYKQSRFVLLQKLWSKGIVQKGWTNVATSSNGNGCESTYTSEPPVSQYDPLDLFSTDSTRIHAALRALTYETPQNNAKLWIDGRHVALGPVEARERLFCPAPTHQNATPPDWTQAVYRALHLPQASNHLFVHLCAHVLKVEPLLSQVLRLQLLDVLDGDGAVLVYQHLVDKYCGGSREQAERLVDALEEVDVDSDMFGQPSHELEAPPGHPLLSASPFVAPRDSARIVKLCQVVERTQQCLDNSSTAREGSSDQVLQLDQHHQEALDVVGALTKDECVYLLRNWLLSLAMNDVSFFLTLMCDADNEDEKECDVSGTLATDSGSAALPRIAVVRRQTKNCTGLVAVEWMAASDSLRRRRRFHYQIKLIDCEPKPAKKLRNRESKEAPFSLLPFSP